MCDSSGDGGSVKRAQILKKYEDDNFLFWKPYFRWARCWILQKKTARVGLSTIRQQRWREINTQHLQAHKTNWSAHTKSFNIPFCIFWNSHAKPTKNSTVAHLYTFITFHRSFIIETIIYRLPICTNEMVDENTESATCWKLTKKKKLCGIL